MDRNANFVMGIHLLSKVVTILLAKNGRFCYKITHFLPIMVTNIWAKSGNYNNYRWRYFDPTMATLWRLRYLAIIIGNDVKFKPLLTKRGRTKGCRSWQPTTFELASWSVRKNSKRPDTRGFSVNDIHALLAYSGMLQIVLDPLSCVLKTIPIKRSKQERV